MEINQNYIEKDLIEEDEAEKQNFLVVVNAYKCYKRDSYAKLAKRQSFINSMPERHRELLHKYSSSLNSLRNCVDQNSRIIQAMIKNVDSIFNNCRERKDFGSEELTNLTQKVDIEKVTIVLKQIVRDWSILGEPERKSSYQPILNALLEFLKPEKIGRGSTKILIPGAGLGRLVYEIASRGYFAEGNEFSLFMLIASNFVLNQCVIDNQYEFYPYVTQFVNNFNRDDQFRCVKFPDQSPTQNRPKGEMNMIAGDFVQVYSARDQEDEWDAVCTCFFIDCANNILEFIEIIYKVLRNGGIWINLGPLLYHFSDIANEHSIEPSYEDLREIITKVGFKIIKEQSNVKTKYSQDQGSMQQLEYNSVFFVCRKDEEQNEEEEEERNFD